MCCFKQNILMTIILWFDDSLNLDVTKKNFNNSKKASYEHIMAILKNQQAPTVYQEKVVEQEAGSIWKIVLMSVMSVVTGQWLNGQPT